jgi:hypothetical protein
LITAGVEYVITSTNSGTTFGGASAPVRQDIAGIGSATAEVVFAVLRRRVLTWTPRR